MSSETTAFAIEQRQLDSVDQLALIIISDCCGDEFTFIDALEALEKHTSLDEGEAMNAFHMLCDEHIIRVKKGYKRGEPDALHFIMVVRND